ncbi:MULTISPECIES: sulfate adenylyltransferase [Acidithrix]|uniref:Sulfate adenylyltransferase n=1 Tax=Acidithrix ferrooxidans TaxID=1280514 RepID=A0A0D8HGS7_9ACTN|nr:MULTISPECIES: sulfate adenylyltransferase [Acidithrix]KJF17200.1 sulfate adenylyltransferase [Acidithrix ferrooxidans]
MSFNPSDPIAPPHGGELIHFEITAPFKVDKFIDIELSPRQRADLEMIFVGAYSPLSSFLGRDDYHCVLDSMKLSDGTLWPLPITFVVSSGELATGTAAAKLHIQSVHVATMIIRERFPVELHQEAQSVYGTTDSAHPGVATLINEGDIAIAGELFFHQPVRDFRGSEYLTPTETRSYFHEQRWNSVVAFQTRNPIHRAHEYLHKVALELVDGLFINPLVGHTKDDDVPSEVRMEAYRTLLDNYYPRDRVLLGVYPAAMRYAGPKEAILHALSRKNYGCTHFIVGRDHAGVGDYYGTYAAQEIFSTLDPSQLGIEIMKFEHSFFCLVCEQVVSKRTCPHPKSSHLILSGTKVRELLSRGVALPSQYSRPEVASVLAAAYL